MRTHYVLKALSLLVFSSISLKGQVEINDTTKPHQLKEAVVTSTRFAVDPKTDGRVVTIIEGETLQQYLGLSVTEALSELSQLHVDGNFTHPGNNLSYYLRGGRNGQILVLIDGVPANDPSDINRSFDFKNLPVSNIERIEIVKGGLSALYGTDAVAGVINIITRKNSGKKTDTYGGINAGNYRSWDMDWGLQGSQKSWSYLLHGGYESVGGLSAAIDTNSLPLIDSSFNPPAISPFDKDPFGRVHGLMKLAYAPGSAFHISTRAEYENYKANIDNGTFADDINREYKSTRKHITLNPVFYYPNGELTGYISQTGIKRIDNNDSLEFAMGIPLYSYTNGYADDAFTSSLTQAGIINRYKIGKYFKSQVGVEYQRASYSSDLVTFGDYLSPEAGKPVGREVFSQDSARHYKVDPYASLLFSNLSGLSAHAGFRLNNHSSYGIFPAYTFNPAYLFKVCDSTELKVFGSISNALKAPSLYQLFSSYGNRELKPEESIALEAGLSLYYKQLLTVQLAFFARQEKENIIFGMMGYENGGSRQVRGLDAEVNVNPRGPWMINGFVALANSDDTASFYRIPKTRFGLNGIYRFCQKAEARVSLSYTGSRTIFDFGSFSEVELPPYTLLHVSGSYKIARDKVAIMVSVNNLLNHQFVAVDGFTTKGIQFRVGMRFLGI